IVAAFEEQFGNDRVNEVERWKGVTRVDPALVLPVELSARGVTHDGALTAAGADAQFHGYEITAGDAGDALRAGRLVMAESVARKLRVGVGDSVVADSPYVDDDLVLTVGALSDETLGGPVFANVDVGRQLAGSARPTFNTLYLNAEPRYAESLRQDLYDLPSASQVQVKATLVDKLTEYLGLLLLWGGILLGFGYLMAFAVIYNTFTANVLERTREIATMRTIGESNARLAVMITIENLLLAVVGIPLGVWLGLRAADALYASFSTEAYTFKAIVFPSSVAWVSASVVVVMLLSELPPIRRIFRLDLAEATKVME
ncbi:MAG: FtsX-like permease family protein, partial [Coriobacteriales bacterium]|nr:FtsX-like permease family protein [Coriobacteriales bacterium]